MNRCPRRVPGSVSPCRRPSPMLCCHDNTDLSMTGRDAVVVADCGGCRGMCGGGNDGVGAAHAETTPQEHVLAGVPLRVAVQRPVVADERRKGYQRSKSKHWATPTGTHATPVPGRCRRKPS